MGNREIGERIQSRRAEVGLTLDDVAREIGVDKPTIQRYEKGKISKLKMPIIQAISRVLGVNPAWIVGKSDVKLDEIGKSRIMPPNMEPLEEMEKVPLLGRIACGTPILAEENIEDYVDLPKHIRADYALICKGQSMINAGIHDGDVVYIRRQERVSNGQIAAVIVDDNEATLKRFYYDGTTVTLVAENPAEPPRVFTGEEINRQRVVGLAVAFTSAIK